MRYFRALAVLHFARILRVPIGPSSKLFGARQNGIQFPRTRSRYQ